MSSLPPENCRSKEGEIIKIFGAIIFVSIFLLETFFLKTYPFINFVSELSIH